MQASTLVSIVHTLNMEAFSSLNTLEQVHPLNMESFSSLNTFEQVTFHGNEIIQYCEIDPKYIFQSSPNNVDELTNNFTFTEVTTTTTNNAQLSPRLKRCAVSIFFFFLIKAK